MFAPLDISESLTSEDRSAYFITGELHINLHNSTNLGDPKPLGYLQIPISQVSSGVKVQTKGGPHGAAAYPDGEGWQAATGIRLSWFLEK